MQSIKDIFPVIEAQKVRDNHNHELSNICDIYQDFYYEANEYNFSIHMEDEDWEISANKVIETIDANGTYVLAEFEEGNMELYRLEDNIDHIPFHSNLLMRFRLADGTEFNTKANIASFREIFRQVQKYYESNGEKK